MITARGPSSVVILNEAAGEVSNESIQPRQAGAHRAERCRNFTLSAACRLDLTYQVKIAGSVHFIDGK